MPDNKAPSALVFFDLDGTLLNEKKRIPDSALEAIKQLQINGHLAFLNTGRAYSIIQPHILAPGFDGIIAGCGTWIQFQGELLLNVTIPSERVLRLIGLFEQYQIDAWFEGQNHVYVKDRSPDKILEVFQSYLAELPDTLAEWGEHPVIANKLTYRLHPWSRLNQCLSMIEEHFYLIRHMPFHGEIVPNGYSKATGIQYLMNRLNIPRDRTYAFGDSLNDLDMLSFSGHGIAMAGSSEQVQNVSDYVTSAADDHGIAEGLRHFGLI